MALRVGFTASAFDLLHAGHIMMLEEAREQCDFLIVGLQTDPSIDRSTKNKPIQSLIERQIQLEGCKFVDEVRVYQSEAELMELLEILRPTVRIVGEEYRDKDFTGKQWCIDNGVEIYYNSRKHNFSTSELRTRIKQA